MFPKSIWCVSSEETVLPACGWSSVLLAAHQPTEALQRQNIEFSGFSCIPAHQFSSFFTHILKDLGIKVVSPSETLNECLSPANCLFHWSKTSLASCETEVLPAGWGGSSPFWTVHTVILSGWLCSATEACLHHQQMLHHQHREWPLFVGVIKQSALLSLNCAPPFQEEE